MPYARMRIADAERQLKAVEKAQGLGGGGIFKFEEGEHKIRILALHMLHPLATHFLGKKGVPCYGADEGCPYHGEQAPPGDDGEPKAPSIKLLAYVVNAKETNPRVQRADLAYTIVKKIVALQKDEDYSFEGFPMPYDLKIKYDKKQAGAAMYEVVPSPKSEEVPEYVLDELAKKKPLAQVVEDEMNRGKNMDD